MPVTTLKIEQELINEGQAKTDKEGARTMGCPVFLAARKAIPHVSHVSPTHIIRYLPDGTEERILLPKEIQRFIRCADIQAAVKAGRPFKKDENDIYLEPLKPVSFQVQYGV